LGVSNAHGENTVYAQVTTLNVLAAFRYGASCHVGSATNFIIYCKVYYMNARSPFKLGHLCYSSIDFVKNRWQRPFLVCNSYRSSHKLRVSNSRHDVPVPGRLLSFEAMYPDNICVPSMVVRD
jgi:hypothetical protein